jgi:hypothetical protein
MATPGYAVLDAEGKLISVEPSAMDAVGVAGDSGARQVVVEDEPADLHGVLGDAYGLGDPDVATVAPAKAFIATGLPRLDLDDVMRMSKEEAHRKLRPYFPTERHRAGKVITSLVFDKVSGLYKALLGQNYKTGKTGDDEVQRKIRAMGFSGSEVQGLSILPYSLALGLSSGDEQGARMQRLLKHQGEYPKFRTMCAGSNAACRQSCLVYAGQNESDPYNVISKAARTEALLSQPEAFVRMLAESIRLHTTRISGAGWLPFIRLNVFSDIPWELFVPGLFDHFRDVRFYDYTKVPGRRPPSNYDLTFSFSGTNAKAAHAELERGKRIAVVFLLKGGMVERRHSPLPPEWCGFKTVDGDVSDLRPLDPGGVVVGLRWKMPMHDKAARDTNTAFVVKVWEECGSLVAATSARQEPIHDADQGEE